MNSDLFERTAEWHGPARLPKGHQQCAAGPLLKVPREDLIPAGYRDFAYEEVPLPLPGRAATISCPHSYLLFYEPLGLGLSHRFLEIGNGSGYGAAVAREVVGDTGQVTSIDLLGRLEALAQVDPRIAKAIAHVSPAERSFDFATPDELRVMARQAVVALAPRVSGKTFHVRMHRRRWKGCACDD